MKRIKGIVRTVMAIAGAISLNSPMMGMVAAGSGQGFTSNQTGTRVSQARLEPYRSMWINQSPSEGGWVSSRKGIGVDSKHSQKQG